MYLQICTSRDNIKIYGPLYTKNAFDLLGTVQKPNFSLRIYSINVTKSAGNCFFFLCSLTAFRVIHLIELNHHYRHHVTDEGLIIYSLRLTPSSLGPKCHASFLKTLLWWCSNVISAIFEGQECWIVDRFQTKVFLNTTWKHQKTSGGIDRTLTWNGLNKNLARNK